MLSFLRRLRVARVARSSGSEAYWQRRYEVGGDSGRGSYGRYAEFKAGVLNDFVAENDVESVLELGCGDGNQLALARYPSYVGFDVSERAVQLCRQRFAGDPTKSFATLPQYVGQRADLALSLDVVYHLIEDDAFLAHMELLFGAADRFVAVYSSDAEVEAPQKAHVRHRRFSDWVEEHAPRWEPLRRIPNPYDTSETAADFHIFRRSSDA